MVDNNSLGMRWLRILEASSQLSAEVPGLVELRSECASHCGLDSVTNVLAGDGMTNATVAFPMKDGTRRH